MLGYKTRPSALQSHQTVRAQTQNSSAIATEHRKPSTQLARASQPPSDPDPEERRDQRIGNWIVVVAYGGSGLLILGGLIAIAKLL